MKNDDIIVDGLKRGYKQRVSCENELYEQYRYFIHEGSKKFHITYDDAFSAYSDAVLATILSIVNGRFESKSSLKTFLFRVFSNKCVDLVRKNSTNQETAQRNKASPEMLDLLPDNARTAVEHMIDRYRENAILEHLEVIGEKCKEILLYYEDGYSDKEIAELLSYNNALVAKTTRHRCLEKLKEKMDHIIKLA